MRDYAFLRTIRPRDRNIPLFLPLVSGAWVIIQLDSRGLATSFLYRSARLHDSRQVPKKCYVFASSAGDIETERVIDKI